MDSHNINNQPALEEPRGRWVHVWSNDTSTILSAQIHYKTDKDPKKKKKTVYLQNEGFCV